MAAMAMRVMFRLPKSTADTADRRPKRPRGDQSCMRIILNIPEFISGLAAGVDRRRSKWLIVESRQTHALALFLSTRDQRPFAGDPGDADGHSRAQSGPSALRRSIAVSAMVVKTVASVAACEWTGDNGGPQ